MVDLSGFDLDPLNHSSIDPLSHLGPGFPHFRLAFKKSFAVVFSTLA